MFRVPKQPFIYGSGSSFSFLGVRRLRETGSSEGCDSIFGLTWAESRRVGLEQMNPALGKCGWPVGPLGVQWSTGEHPFVHSTGWGTSGD